MIIRIPGVKQGKSSTGRIYYYHRKTKTPLPGAPGSAEFMEALGRLNAGEQVNRRVPGSFGELVEAYRSTPEWTSRAPRTQADYQKVFDYLKGLDKEPLERFTVSFLYKIRDKAAASRKRRFAIYVIQVLSLLFSWAERRGRWGLANPAKAVQKVPKPRDAKEANRPWSEVELQTTLDAAPVELSVGIALAAYVGMDTPDLIAVEWSAYAAPRDGQPGRIAYRRHKTGVLAELRVHSRLVEVLDEAFRRRKAGPVVVGERGHTLTAEGFRTNFFKLIARLEKEGRVGPDLTIKGLRHTLGTHLAEAGCDPPTIAAVLGQKTTAMAEHYSRRAKRGRLADAAIERLEEIATLHRKEHAE